MADVDQVDALIEELRLTRQGLAKLEDEVRRLADQFAKMLNVEPVTARREPVSPLAEAAGGLIDHLVNGGRKRRTK